MIQNKNRSRLSLVDGNLGHDIYASLSYCSLYSRGISFGPRQMKLVPLSLIVYKLVTTISMHVSLDLLEITSMKPR